jgi:hypothetical protein
MKMEQLESRMMLTTTPLITEFMADNNVGLTDEDGAHSDWIEIYNPTPASIDLENWSLTDEAINLTKWQFPDVSLGSGDFLVLFASGANRVDPQSELHTNFTLSKNGEYLALVEPDGTTVAHEFAPEFPEQFSDISYGPEQVISDIEFVAIDAVGQVLLPAAANEDVATATWTAASFNDAGWLSKTQGIGFDNGGGELNPLIHASGDVSAMQNTTASAYQRHAFDINGAIPNLDEFNLNANYDDGFVAYLNGVEVASDRAPASLAWDSTATGDAGGILDSVDYPNFSDAAATLSLNGSAVVSGSALRLTTAGNQAAAVWTSNPVSFDSDYSFSAYMEIDVHTAGGASDADGLGADGMTFAIQSGGNSRIGNPGGGIGIEGTGMPFVAVEFDTWSSGVFDEGASLPTHIGIDTSVSGSVSRISVPRFNGGSPGQNIRYVWVDFDGITEQMDVYFGTSATKPASPTLSATVDVAGVFNGVSELYSGFTAGTGGATNIHDVNSFNLQTGAGELGLATQQFNLLPHVGLLQTGTNVLAVHGLNSSAADDDFLQRFELNGIEHQVVQLNSLKYFFNPTPEDVNGLGTEAPAPEVDFSVDSGTFTTSFPVTLTTTSPTASIYYTLDGSIPDDSSSLYSNAVTVSASSLIRARAYETGRAPSAVTSESYIMIDASLTNFQDSGGAFNTNLPIAVFDSFGDASVQSNDRLLIPVASAFIDTSGNDDRAEITDAADVAGMAGLRIRGQSSQGWAKKQYALELWGEGHDASSPILAEDAQDRSEKLFGLSKESDWVLNGPYSDKSQLNNFLTFGWSNELGQYGPGSRLIEVFVNADNGSVSYPNDYRGTYVLLEKIKVDSGRVDIERLTPTDNAEPDITGGYIWKKDKAGAGDVPFTTSRNQVLRHVEPSDSEITPAQTDWLTDHLNEFETALYGANFDDPDVGYAAYIDIDSWVDIFLLVEFTKNIDGFRLSTYYHKDEGGKIKQGPVWDYNLSLANANYLSGSFPQGWYHSSLSEGDYPYWRRLFQDQNFVQRVVDRWTELRHTTFSDESLLADIDDGVAQLTDGDVRGSDAGHDNPISRNFQRWGTVSSYLWPNCFFGQGGCPASPIGHSPATYTDYIDIMKWFVVERAAWIDSQYVVAPAMQLDGQTVSLTAPSGAIYYTTDGTDPIIRIDDSPSETTILDAGDDATVFVPSNSSLGDTWKAIGFDDSSWTDVQNGVGFDGTGDFDSHIDSDISGVMQGVNASGYLRIPFNVTSPDAFDTLQLRVKYDDAFVAFLNGVQIVRASNAPSFPAWNSIASLSRNDLDAVQYVEYNINSRINQLVAGENILSFQMLNRSVNDDDLLLSAQINAGSTFTPVLSPSAQLYTGPFNVGENTSIVSRAFSAVHSIFETTDFSGLGHATAVVDELDIVITEVNYNPVDPTVAEAALLNLPVGDVNNDDFEFIEIKNIGSETISLVDVTLSNAVDFTFPDIDLASDELVVVVRDVATFEARYGSGINVAGVYEGGLNNSSDTIVLSDGNGVVIQQFTYSDGGGWPGRADGNGSTLEIVDVDGDSTSGSNWNSSTEYLGTPGGQGVGRLFSVVINEVLSHTDLPSVDTVEIFNNSGVAVDIGGWFLSDSNSNYLKYEFPLPTLIQDGQYFLVDESNFNPTPLTPGPNDFALNAAHGDELWLTATGGGQITMFMDHVEFGAQANGESWGRWPNATGVIYPSLNNSLGQVNTGPRVGPVVITEVNYNPVDPDDVGPILASNLEFVEIYNGGSVAEALTNWELESGVNFIFPAGYMLGVGETLVVLPFDPDLGANAQLVSDFQTTYGIDGSVALVGPFSGQLSNGGETVRLIRPDGEPLDEPGFIPELLEDEVPYDDETPWPTTADGLGDSLARLVAAEWGHDPFSFYAAPPTPGSVVSSPQVLSILRDFDKVDPSDLLKGPQPTDWATQRSDLTSLTIQLNAPLQITPADIRLTNLGVNAPLEADTVIPLTVDHLNLAGTTLSIDFDPYELPDGVYRFEILPTATTPAGLSIDGNGDGTTGDAFVYEGDSGNRFYKLTSEFSGDEGVSVFDFTTFSYWFGVSLPTAPQYADVNNDLGVSVFDFTPFANNFGTGITYPVAFAAMILPVGDERTAGNGDTEEAENEVVLQRVDSDFADHRIVDSERLELELVGDAIEMVDDWMDVLADDLAQIWEQ